MRLLLLNFFLLFNLLLFGDSAGSNEDDVFARTPVIADVSISKVEDGYVSLTVHQYLRGAGIPREIKINDLSIKDDLVDLKNLAGGRYIFLERVQAKLGNKYFPVRVNSKNKREVNYRRTWIPFEKFKILIPEQVKYGEADPQKVLACLSVFGTETLHLAAPELRKNREFITMSLIISPNSLAHAWQGLRNDFDFMIKAVKNDPSVWVYTGPELWENQRYILTIADLIYSKPVIGPLQYFQSGALLRNISEKLKNDKDFVIKIVKKNGTELQFALEKWRSDKDVVRAAGVWGWQYADSELLNDRELALEMIEQNGYAYHHLPYRLKSERKIALKSVKTRGALFSSSSFPEEFKDDREMALAAAENYGFALMNMNEKFKDDKEIVLAAVKSYPDALGAASERLRKDREIALLAVRKRGYCLDKVHIENPAYREIALAALKQEPHARNIIPYALLKDVSFLKKAIPLSPRIIGRIPFETIKNQAVHEELTTIALEANPFSLAGISNPHTGPDAVIEIAKKHFSYLVYARDSKDPRIIAMRNSRKLVKKALRNGDLYALSAASEKLQKDLELVKILARLAEEQGVNLFNLIDPSFWKDKKVLLELVKISPKLIVDSPNSAFLRRDKQLIYAALQNRPDLINEVLSWGRGGVQWDSDIRQVTGDIFSAGELLEGVIKSYESGNAEQIKKYSQGDGPFMWAAKDESPKQIKRMKDFGKFLRKTPSRLSLHDGSFTASFGPAIKAYHITLKKVNGEWKLKSVNGGN